ncbi:acetyltransferase, GNAT family [Pediococcus damnosus]|uniref:GNAT family N-acetyltransferase n=1 Tax=Pediococcus damnosus TaxID=51663 RepID=UPI00078BF6F5|nr:GNAT family N-acetyltransferase [Pediococcus damnosus]AMV65239.1 acetyltransferase, GNAT family [Pediococcus damnosus]
MKNLQTKNYELHFPVQSDVDILFRYRSNIEIAHSEGRIPDKSRQETAKFLTQLLSKIDAGIVNYWLISDHTKNHLGGISIWGFNQEKAEAEVGYDILPKFQGKGVISEVFPEIEQYAFTVLKLQKLSVYTSKIDILSQHILRKNHYRLIEHWIEKNLKGEPTDMFHFAKTIEEYQK